MEYWGRSNCKKWCLNRAQIAGLIKHLLEVERQIMSSWSLDPPFTINITPVQENGNGNAFAFEFACSCLESLANELLQWSACPVDEYLHKLLERHNNYGLSEQKSCSYFSINNIRLLSGCNDSNQKIVIDFNVGC